ELRVGNLYLNRGTTGAAVGRQPFGGLKSSGAGWKAGGPDYVKQFLESRTITENTLPHGVVPAIRTQAARSRDRDPEASDRPPKCRPLPASFRRPRTPAGCIRYPWAGV